MKFKFSSIVAKNVNMRQACSRSRKKRLDSIQNNVSHIASPSFDESFDPATSRDFGVEGQEFKIYRMDADSKAQLMQDTERITIPQPTSSEEQHPLQNHGLRPPTKRNSVERRSKQGVSPWQGGQGRSALDSATAGTTLYLQKDGRTTKEIGGSSQRRKIEDEADKAEATHNRKSTDIEKTAETVTKPTTDPAQLSLDLSFLGALDRGLKPTTTTSSASPERNQRVGKASVTGERDLLPMPTSIVEEKKKRKQKTSEKKAFGIVGLNTS
jgi:hypothetical protein